MSNENVKSLDEIIAELEAQPVTSAPSAQRLEQKADDLLEQEAFRRKVNVYIDEYILTEPFIVRIQKYARQEFQNMAFAAAKAILGIALGTAIALLVTFMVTGQFK